MKKTIVAAMIAASTIGFAGNAFAFIGTSLNDDRAPQATALDQAGRDTIQGFINDNYANGTWSLAQAAGVYGSLTHQNQLALGNGNEDGTWGEIVRETRVEHWGFVERAYTNRSPGFARGKHDAPARDVIGSRHNPGQVPTGGLFKR